MFKRAVATLVGIPISRFASLHFSLDGPEQTDSLVLSSADDKAPGISSDQPFMIILSQILDGIAEPVISPSCRYKLAYPGRPVGWKEARMKATNVPSIFFPTGPESYAKRPPELGENDASDLVEGQLLYIDPQSLCRRPEITWAPTIRIILPRGWIGCEFSSTDLLFEPLQICPDLIV